MQFASSNVMRTIVLLQQSLTMHCHTTVKINEVNRLESKGNYSATTNIMKLVHLPLMGGLLHLVQRGGDWAGPQPTQSLLAVPNVTAHPLTASVPTSYYSM